MIKDRNTLDYIFTLVKNVKKPLVKIYPDGRIYGTDEQFASFNMIVSDNIQFDISVPYIFASNNISAFMREIKDDNTLLKYDIYSIKNNHKNSNPIYTELINLTDLTYNFDDLFARVANYQSKPILYIEENFQLENSPMFTMKMSDFSKMFTVDRRYIMSSFNSIHPANKSDRVDLIIRDADYWSYTAEFIIYKKKDKYQLHEFLRFRKL